MKKYLLVTASAVSLFLTACSSGDFEKLNTTFQADFNKGNYQAASTNLVKATAAKDDDGNDTLGENTYLVGLQAGTASLWANNAKESVKNFEFAEAVAQEKLENESGYDPKYYESIMVQTYKSVASLSESDVDTATVMLNRANEMQNRALEKNSEAIKGLMDKLKEAASKVPDLKDIDLTKKIQTAQKQLDGNVQIKAATDYMNPYTSYLYGIVKAVDGNSMGDSALQRVAEQAPKNKYVKTDAEAAKGKGSVWVVFENGLVGAIKPISTEVSLIGQWNMNIAIPTVDATKAPVSSLTVKSGNTTAKTEFIANLDSVVATELKEHETVNIIKSMIFELGKMVVVAGACGGLKDSCSGYGLMMAQRAQAAEYPWDLRSWTSLPKEVQVARVDMPSNKVINVSEVGDISLPKDAQFALVIVKKPTAEAKATYIVTKLK